MKHTKLAAALFFIATVAVAGKLYAGDTVDGLVSGCANIIAGCNDTFHSRKTGYKEVAHPSDNYARDKVNDVQGVILHHTAEPTVQRSLEVLTSKERGVSTHVVIDTDGTRYIMEAPRVVAYHAGYSLLNGRERCNEWTLGIEFQGNTLEAPLTQDQIDSAIEWLLPLIAEYHIPIENIASHEMIRNNYKKKHPENKKAYPKPDITQKEYLRFMEQLRAALAEQ